MNKLKKQKAVLLFEVMIVVLFVAIASLYMFRSYSIFLKVGAKSTQYLTMIQHTGRVAFDIALAEHKGSSFGNSTQNIELDDDYNYSINIEDTEFEGLKKGRVKIESKKRKASFDSVIYLLSQ